MGICGKTVLVSILSLSLDYSTRQSHGPPRITSFLFEIIVIKQRAYCKCAYSKQAQETIMRGHLTQLSERLFREKQRLQFLHRMFWRSNSMSNSPQVFKDFMIIASLLVDKSQKREIRSKGQQSTSLTSLHISLSQNSFRYHCSHLTQLSVPLI